MSPPIEVPPLDASLGVHVIFVSVPRPEVIFLKVLLESFEGVAAFRTQDAEHVPGRGLVAVLAPPAFAADAVAILDEIVDSTGLTQHTATPADLIALYAALEPNDEVGRR